MNIDSKHDFPYIVNVCYIFNDRGEVLLQQKARGFGQGNWNGPGGKLEKAESPEDSVKREVAEETGLMLKTVKKAGELEFVFLENEEINNFCHVFTCNDYEGEPIDKGEGALKWFVVDEVPLEKMWDDDKYWLMDVLCGKCVHKRFYFDENKKVSKYFDLA